MYLFDIHIIIILLDVFYSEKDFYLNMEMWKIPRYVVSVSLPRYFLENMYECIRLYFLFKIFFRRIWILLDLKKIMNHFFIHPPFSIPEK